MSIRPWRDIQRKKTKKIKVGDVFVGGDSHISVQSMTNTLTTDINATINQIRSLENVGADLVRVSCPDEESSLALKKIVKEVKIPIIADIHFHYKRAIEAAESGASCLRINPGNIGKPERVKEVIKAAKDNGCQIIASVHDINGTPDASTIASIVRDNQGAGDIVKFCGTANNHDDALQSQVCDVVDTFQRTS